ncbi:hypothetical protein BCON_0042g00070 [Botryotinia convoluta]|uniref:Uncharacterized protein n=1 Tax=Botryotinia convoluta TaxID=54673 RepID=A0A4Z1IK75_9HELO|nr:hypothetical protein BCON_0042g00070 [Botryotinia convoluta]
MLPTPKNLRGRSHVFPDLNFEAADHTITIEGSTSPWYFYPMRLYQRPAARTSPVWVGNSSGDNCYGGRETASLAFDQLTRAILRGSKGYFSTTVNCDKDQPSRESDCDVG